MRIVYITAGAGSLHCGACERDVSLIRALNRAGHDCQLIPLYTPVRTDEGYWPSSTIFMGGISVWATHHWPVLGVLPRFFWRCADHPAILKFITALAIETRPERLGPLTVSMLSGHNGPLRGMVRTLAEHLQKQPAPDAINLGNALLLGVAPELKQRLGTLLVCTLQGEDVFVEALREPYRTRARELMREHARAVDLFVAQGQAQMESARVTLDLPARKCCVVPPGLGTFPAGRPEVVAEQAFTIGYLSAITPAKGLDLLVEAFIRLARKSDSGALPRLLIAGQTLNRPYLKEQLARLRRARLDGCCRFLGAIPASQKAEFFKSCALLCVPSRYPEARGMAALEAQAFGTPVLAPRSGIFPEMLERTQGGVLFAGGDAGALAEALERLRADPLARQRLARQAWDGVRRHYSAEDAAAALARIYEQRLGGHIQA